MMDETLKKGILDYYELIDKGLKNEASDTIVEAMHYFDQLSEEARKEFAYHCCAAMLEEKQGELTVLFAKHNLIPYELSSRLSEITRADYEQNKMPQIRWYYKLFLPELEIIRVAYEHPDCDEETIQDYFSALLYILYQGAQYLPKECLIDQEAYKETMEECKKIMENHSIEKTREEDFYQYKRSYEAWWAANA